MNVTLYGLHELGRPTLVVFPHALMITSVYRLSQLTMYRISDNVHIITLATVLAAAQV